MWYLEDPVHHVQLPEEEDPLAGVDIFKVLDNLLDEHPRQDPVQLVEKKGDPLAETDMEEKLGGFLSDYFTPELVQSAMDIGGDGADIAFHPAEVTPQPTAAVALPQPDHGPTGVNFEWWSEWWSVGAVPEISKEWPTPPAAAPTLDQAHPSVWTGPPSQEQTVERISLTPCTVKPAAPPVAGSSRKRKRGNRGDDDQPYVKKPPNAFMLFLKEQRPIVAAKLGATGSAAVNAEVGKKWKSLPDQDRQRFYDQARVEAELHQEKYPGWTTASNYRKKRPRVRATTKT